MLKKKYNLNKQISLKVNYLETWLESLLTKSLEQNMFLNPTERISYSLKRADHFDFFNFFATYQKLHCLITLSPKVPNKKFYYSRFFFNKQLNYLTCANTLK